MEGIYDEDKSGRIDFACERFSAAGRALRVGDGALPLVMACTEIPLALQQVDGVHDRMLVDPAEILTLARLAYGNPG